MIKGYTKSLVFTALFAGLAYVSNFLMLIIPNVSLAFFVVFMAGYFLGFRWGAVSGGLTFFLISYFNPYGMAMLPLIIVQILGGAIVGLCGAAAYRIFQIRIKDWRTYPLYSLWGIIASSIYMGLISLADAVLFGPFKERILISLGFSILTIVSNLIIFPVLAPLINSVREIVGERG